MINSLIISLFLTIMIEVIVSFLIGIRNKNDILIVILANIITNPVVVYISNLIKIYNDKLVYSVVVSILEIIVIIIEWEIFEKYMYYTKKKKLCISIINNAISFSIGFLLNIIIKGGL